MRDERGLKQLYISRKAHVTQAHLSRIENDESGVTEHTLRKIAEAMGVSYEELAILPKWVPTPDDTGSISDILSDDTAMLRFLGGEKPDAATYDWVKRSLEVIRAEVDRKLRQRSQQRKQEAAEKRAQQ